MTARRGLQLVIGVGMLCLPLAAEAQNWQGASPDRAATESPQPVYGPQPQIPPKQYAPAQPADQARSQGQYPPPGARPAGPGMQPDMRPAAGPVLRRVGPPQPGTPGRPQPSPPPPVQLSPEEEADLDQLLQAWEQRSRSIKTFECKLYRWQYRGLGNADEKPPAEKGVLKYSAPDKGYFSIDGVESDDPNQRATWPLERWVCDGKSVYQYDFAQKQIVEHRLPPELQGQAITDGPLPFLFGAEAAKLRTRYFLKVTTPPQVQDQVWLTAFPRFMNDAQNFRRAELILARKDLQPMAIQLLPPGDNRVVFRFDEVRINAPNPLVNLRFFKQDPFRPNAPSGEWKRVLAKESEAQAERPQGPPRR